MNYICHSGGCPGADMAWENEGFKYGVTTIAYSFRTHVQEGKNPKILTVKELSEGWEHVKVADKTLNKNVERLPSPYMCNLLCRNWFQVKNSDIIFAIIKQFLGIDKKTVDGGTGWAVQMAIDNKPPVFVFDQYATQLWNVYDYTTNRFEIIMEIPKLTENFAGIGTIDINSHGLKAIQEIYKYNFARG